MNELTHIVITIAVVIMLLAAEHFVPRLFFWLLFIAARHTPLSYIMTWRTCSSVYYTNDLQDSKGEPVADASEVHRHFKEIGGLEVPADINSIRSVREDMTIVSLGRRYVGWSSKAPKRMRMFGFLHDGRLLYGVWHDWQHYSRYRGVVLMDIDPRGTGAIGIWAGGPIREARQNAVRVFPWVWTEIAVCGVKGKRPTGQLINGSV